MNRCNRKIIFRIDLMDEIINYELDDGEELAAYDGSYGYMYEDTIELRRRSL